MGGETTGSVGSRRRITAEQSWPRDNATRALVHGGGQSTSRFVGQLGPVGPTDPSDPDDDRVQRGSGHAGLSAQRG